jgi:hypothetical protein
MHHPEAARPQEHARMKKHVMLTHEDAAILGFRCTLAEISSYKETAIREEKTLTDRARMSRALGSTTPRLIVQQRIEVLFTACAELSNTVY